MSGEWARASTRRRCGVMFATACAAAWWPTAASAHLVSSGVGPFYDGVAHLFVSPDDLMLVLAMSLFAGLCGRDAARAAVLALPAAWLVGLVAGRSGVAGLEVQWLTSVTGLGAGLVLAIRPRVVATVVAGVAAVAGLLHGWLNGASMAASQTSWTAGVGIALAVACVAVVAAAVATALKPGWPQITVRVVGSWIAAIALLSLAWQLRPEAAV